MHTEIRENFSYQEDGQTLEKVFHSGGGLLVLGETQTIAGQGPAQSAQGLSAWLDWRIPKSPFSVKDSVLQVCTGLPDIKSWWGTSPPTF